MSYTSPEAFVLGFSTMKKDPIKWKGIFGKFILQLDPRYGRTGASVIPTLIINNELQPKQPQVKYDQFNCANYNRDPTLYRPTLLFFWIITGDEIAVFMRLGQESQHSSIFIL